MAPGGASCPRNLHRSRCHRSGQTLEPMTEPLNPAQICR
jgi:hypothetical protein